MAEVHCKRCGSTAFVKSGFVHGHQRCRCRECDCNFTDTPRRGRPAAMNAVAVPLYAMGNVSYGMIARLFGVSEVAVFIWIRKRAAALPEPTIPAEVEIVQLDEMWHFADGKNKCWLWRAFDPVGWRTPDEPGFWVNVTIRPARNSSIKSGSKAGYS
jgi:transposase-like protein